MSNITRLPTLYALSSTGKIKVINYSVVLDEFGVISINNEHGYIDGKKQLDKTVISVGKNIGRANATTPHQQAIKEMNAKWTAKKLKKNYTENESGIPDTTEKSLLPMLAHKFTEREHDIKYPCLLQPKLDGLRCMARMVNGEVIFTSRGYKEYCAVQHLALESKWLIRQIAETANVQLSEVILDGELFTPELSLQEINRRVKKYRGTDTHEIQYHVYDIVIGNKTNEERNQLLMSSILLARLTQIKGVFTARAEEHKEEIIHWHDDFVESGYEGIIVRNMNGLYKLGQRSVDLQKFKNFQDAEFEVVGYTSAETGREKGAIIFKCKEPDPLNGHDGIFSVRTKDKVQDRIDMFNNNPEQYIGKLLTVRFAMDKSEDNIPQFPVGVVFRLD